MRLTKEETILICSLLAALLIGGVVKHLRTQARLRTSTPAATVAK
jgi:hypothetical protein